MNGASTLVVLDESISSSQVDPLSSGSVGAPSQSERSSTHPAESIDEGGKTSDFLLHAVQTLSSPGYSIIDAQLVRGSSSFNRIIKAKMQAIPPQKENNDRLIRNNIVDSFDDKTLKELPVDNNTTTVIFRIPRYFRSEAKYLGPTVKNTAEVLSFLHHCKLSSFLTPEVFEYDETNENPLEHPYMLLSYIPGITLEEAYDDLTLTQKLQIAKSLVTVLAEMESITFAETGRLQCWEELPDKMEFHQRQNFNTTKSRTPKMVGWGVYIKDEVQKSNTTSTLRGLIFEQLDAWDAFAEMYKSKYGEDYKQDCMYEDLRYVAELMDELGYFDSDDVNVLSHWDFKPRNILVKLDHSGAVVAGIIDWDKAQSVPRLIARRPPIWLWLQYPPHWYVDCEETGMRRGCDGDPDLYPLDWFATDGRGRMPLNQDGAKVKKCFDEAAEEAMPGYIEDAYSERARWIRRLLRFLTEGVVYSNDYYRHVVFLEEWCKKNNVNIPPLSNDSEKGNKNSDGEDGAEYYDEEDDAEYYDEEYDEEYYDEDDEEYYDEEDGEDYCGEEGDIKFAAEDNIENRSEGLHEDNGKIEDHCCVYKNGRAKEASIEIVKELNPTEQGPTIADDF